MGLVRTSKIIIVILCLLMTSAVLFWQGKLSSRQKAKEHPLAETLQRIGQWQNTGDIPLAEDIVTALQLDDFVFRNFSNGKHVLSLYIGYYNSRKKIGAAHDPLVCFLGQGWVLSDVEQGYLPLELERHDVELHLSTMVAEREGKRVLLVYWFQAYDRATPGTLPQKMALLRSRLLGGGEDNAFVRISISLEELTKEQALQEVRSFIRVFYPIFHAYVLNEETR